MAKPLVKPLKTLVPGYRDMFNLSGQLDTIFDGQKSGVTVDAFKAKIRDRRDAASNYSMDALRVLYANPIACVSNYQVVQGIFGSQKILVPAARTYRGYYGNFVIPNAQLPHVATISAANETEALSRAYSSFKSSYEGFNSLNFLGEFGESLRMLRNPASALVSHTGRFLDTLKSTRKEVRSRVKPRKSDTPQSLRRRRMNSVKDAVSGSWLEFAFGWTPLVNDVKDIAETAGRALVGTLPAFRSHGTSRVGPLHGPFRDPLVVVPESGSPTRILLTGSYQSSASVRYTVLSRVVRIGPARGLSDLAVLSGFSLENVIPTAYQLAPWSFLIDYFTNLGDVIEAWSMDTSNVFSVSKTVRQVTDTEHVEALYQIPGTGAVGNYVSGRVVGNATSRRRLTRTTLTRTVSSSLPMPTLQTKIPGIDSTKWINMAALLAQAKAFRF